jgi:hypothetical protein
MQYLLLIYTDENAPRTDEENHAEIQAYMAVTEQMKEAGVLRAGDALQPTATATTVRRREGKTLTIDGPFAETKEQLGGYYLIEVPSLDEALSWAARMPSATYGSIEVRPILAFE